MWGSRLKAVRTVKILRTCSCCSQHLIVFGCILKFNVVPLKKIKLKFREMQKERWDGERQSLRLFQIASVGTPPHSFFLPHPSHIFNTHSMLKCPNGYVCFHPAPSSRNQKGCKCFGVSVALKLSPWRQKRPLTKWMGKHPTSSWGHRIAACADSCHLYKMRWLPRCVRQAKDVTQRLCGAKRRYLKQKLISNKAVSTFMKQKFELGFCNIQWESKNWVYFN